MTENEIANPQDPLNKNSQYFNVPEFLQLIVIMGSFDSNSVLGAWNPSADGLE
ncbi:MAG: hypothetical protein IIB44_03895 [Candidatus Marinimicrobia bacterium]|nr:hypothetical protein [Candidatus Neomarinimicrobiota bacterium]